MGNTLTWPMYRDAILKRFGLAYDDPLAEIKKLKQTGSVHQYIDAYDRLLCRAELQDEHAMSFFITGLQSEIKLAVRMFKLISLAELYGLCKLQESQLNVGMQKGKMPLLPTPSGQVFLLEVIMDNEEQNGEQEIEECLGEEIVWEKELVNEKIDVFSIPTSLPSNRTHDHKIRLKTDTKPINVRPYRHPPTQKDAIEVMVKELLDAVVIRHSQSSFAAPIVMVKKKDGSWHMCIDYRQLNKQTIKDKFPILIIKELIDELHGSVIFLKLDLRSGYHQIRMFEDDIAKTAFKTHEGHYEFLVMTFGLTNAPSTFQALMNEVFRQFLRRADHVEYLGHIITSEGVATNPTKIEAMKSWPTPKTLKQLRGFLGLTSYYRRFIRDYAIISQPLTVLLKKNPFKWDDKAQDAFEELKQAMIHAPVLQMPDFEATFIVETDASGLGIGAVLEQNGHLIAFMNNFSLKYLMDQRFSTPAQLKWLPKLMGFDYEIVYKKRCENVAADALSRLPNTGELLQINVVSLSADLYQKIVKGWEKDKKLQEIVSKLQQDGNSPLPIPERVWTHISMDFIDGLPMSKGKLVLLIVVDRLSKYGHFIPLTHPYSALTMAQPFLDNVYKLHGLPKVIVSDRDTVFHNGQTEVDNRCVECNIRCMTGDKPKEWVQWVPLAEYCVNKSVDRFLVARETVIQLLKFYLLRAQDRKKAMADRKRNERVFGIDDLVLLKLQPYRQSTLRQHKHHKLAPKYYGPFKVIARIGEVAYKLDLPVSSQIHPVFHVSQLNQFKGNVSQVSVTLPQCDFVGVIALEPIAVLDRRMAKRGNDAVVYVLIQWSNEGVNDATWELYDDIAVRFPHLDLNA
ncbi:gypsy/ty3 retroelement polyprotein [Tanacetum coccineum]